jgi:hypothetical protein
MCEQMRVFCFIFSFYLLLLSVQPCQDFAASRFSYPQIENEQAKLHDADKDMQSESHECSPFCICSCRQISVADNFSSPLSKVEVAAFAKSTVQIFYRNTYSHQHLNFIWQPPKFNFTA